MAQCPRCLLDLSHHAATSSGQCPNCGGVVGADFLVETAPASSAGSYSGAAPSGPGASSVLLSRFWRTVRDVIFDPAKFYSANAAMIVSKESLSSALTFAVIVQWLASFFNFIWRLVIGAAIESRLNDFMRIANDVMQQQGGAAWRGAETLDQFRGRSLDFLFGAGAIVIAPFLTLIKLAISAFFLHLAIRFFTKDSPDRPHSYAATLKILAYASAPWVLCVIPGIGMLAAYLLGFVAIVAGIREVYRTTSGRAVFVALFPELLFLTIVFAIGLFFLLLAFGVLRLVS